MKFKNYEINSDVLYILQHWLDFQKLFSQLVNADHILTLEDALNACGISFLGNNMMLYMVQEILVFFI